jgi:hypothetical protein
VHRICHKCRTEFEDDTSPGDGHEEEFPGVDWDVCGYCLPEPTMLDWPQILGPFKIYLN